MKIMLKTLEIKDYALIDKIYVEFGKGLNIITGETGAGKSILVDAMSLLLGERASTEVVRKGAKKSVVEGIFNVEGNRKVKKILDEKDIEFEPELIVRREISPKGSNRCFVNDTPVPLSVVKDLGELLVDLHGQHEHQSLLRTDTHIEFLDDFGNYTGLLNNYKKLYRELTETEKELTALIRKEGLLKEKKDIYEFQIREIDAVSPHAGEEEKLKEELNILENSERLAELTTEVYTLLYESDNSVHDSIVKVKNTLESLSDVDKIFNESSNEAETVLALINDISSFVRSYKDKIDINAEELEEKRERLGSINMLKKKYGGTVSAVIEYRNKINDEYKLAENFSEKIKKLEAELEHLRKSAGEAALKLSLKRKETGKKVKTEIEKVIQSLGISSPLFEVKIINEAANDDTQNYLAVENKKLKFNPAGIDKVEFYISTNPGEDLKPLVKVASGGEVSRIMLSLKTILAKNDKLPLLIFDEIDTGVSGRIAQKVGSALKELASYHQIISITHLPQIAGLADHHYSVEKLSKNERVFSTIRRLTEEERVNEVARLMSGEEITEINIKGAKQLIGIE